MNIFINFNLRRIACIALLALTAGAYSCKTKTENYLPAGYTNHILDVVHAIEDSMDYHTALMVMDSATYGKPLSPEDRFRLYAYREYIYEDKLMDLKTALLYADSMQWLTANYELTDIGSKKFRLHKMIADVSYGMEHYKDAYNNYAIAKKIADTIHSPQIKSKYMASLAMANYRAGRFLESARLFAQAANWLSDDHIADKQYMDFYHQEMLANAGLAYGNNKMTDSSLFFYRWAIDFIQKKRLIYSAKEKRWDEAASIVYGNLASLYKQTGKYDSAKYYFARSIAISNQAGRNIRDRQYNQLKLADLYIDANDLGMAHALLDEVAQTIKLDTTKSSATDSLELACRQTQILSKYYSITGNHKLAFAYLQLSNAAEEEKRNTVQKRILNNLETGIQNAGHEQQITMLEKDSKIRNQRIAILILICVVSVSGAVIVYYNMRLHKLDSIRMKLRNQQIITENSIRHEQLELKMNTERSNYLALLENTDDCLWSLDADLNILAFNKVYREFIYLVSGRYPEVGKKDILQEIDEVFYANILSGYKSALAGATYNSIDKGINTNGRNHDFAMRFNPVTNDKGIIISVSCSRKDITEYFALTDSLKRNTEQFRNIAWIQSHTLRGPLTTIMGIANLLSDYDEDHDRTMNKELLQGMKEKLAEMDSIVGEIVKLTY